MALGKLLNIRSEIKTRTDQVIKCVEKVKPSLDNLASEIHELNELLKEGKSPNSETNKSLEKVGRTVGREVGKLARAFEAHHKAMTKISEALSDER